MKILLLNPKFPDTFWSLKSAIKFISRKSLMPPLGLMTVAALLPESWDKRLIDLNADPSAGQGPPVGRLCLCHGHDDPAEIGGRGSPAVPGAGRQDGGGGAAVHEHAGRIYPTCRSSRAQRGRDHAAAVSGRPAKRHGAENVHHARQGRPAASRRFRCGT